MTALVSILIPCHNAAPWLAKTLESAIAQTWPNLEMILVDDGSTDESWAIAQAFAREHHQGSVPIQLIQQPQQGASAARNRAIQASRGELIQYLDADDFLAPDKIERQMQLWQELSDHQRGYSLIAGEWARFHQDVEEAQFHPQPCWGNHAPVDWLCSIWQSNWMMHPAAWLLPRPLLELAGPWDEQISLNDDGEYFCRVALASLGIQFAWGARSYYRSGNGSSLSGRKSDGAWASALRSLERCRDHLLMAEDSPRTRRTCAILFKRFIYEVYPQVPRLRQQAMAQLKVLGPVKLRPPGSPGFQLVSRLVGWQQAKRLWQWRQQLLAP
jgi:glycosyltransferase involved in cell wall biosynthesis